MSNAIVRAVHQEGLRKMSADQRHGVEQELKDLKDQLKRSEPGDGSAPRPELLQNVPLIQARIKRLEEMLNKDDDLIPKGADKDRAMKRLKEIEDLIKKDLPSEAEQKSLPRINQRDFDRAVNKTVHHQKKYGHLIAEWQELQRRLEPEDPDAADVEKLWG